MFSLVEAEKSLVLVCHTLTRLVLVLLVLEGTMRPTHSWGSIVISGSGILQQRVPMGSGIIAHCSFFSMEKQDKEEPFFMSYCCEEQ
jgi:hypothetical protein